LICLETAEIKIIIAPRKIAIGQEQRVDLNDLLERFSGEPGGSRFSARALESAYEACICVELDKEKYPLKGRKNFG
jgi:hypothetical protein